jgi:hypothetical protein
MTPIEPDRAALEYVHSKLHMIASLDEALKNPTLEIVLKAVARRHMQRRALPDFKKLQANDTQEKN